MPDPEDDPIEPAPEGASCAEHPERDALVTCPRCGSYCCIVCWQGAVRRCHACLLRDPGPPVHWAEPDRGLVSRFFATIADAVHPRASAVRFTRGTVTKAIPFLLLTFLPLALLSGVIPFTHTLGFGPRWAVMFIGTPTEAQLALDVAQAAGLGLLVAAARLGVLGACFAALVSAQGKKIESQPAWQVMLYRAWLVPCSGASGIVLGLVIWGFPPELTDGMRVFAEVASLVPLMLLLAAMISTARQAHGVGPIMSMVIVLASFLAMYIAEHALYQLMGPLLPSSEALRQAVEAAR